MEQKQIFNATQTAVLLADKLTTHISIDICTPNLIGINRLLYKQFSNDCSWQLRVECLSTAEIIEFYFFIPSIGCKSVSVHCKVQSVFRAKK